MPRRANDFDALGELRELCRREMSDSAFAKADGLIAAMGNLATSEDADRGFGIENAAGERAGKPPAFSRPRRYGDDAAMDAAPDSAAGRVARDVAIEHVAPAVGRSAVVSGRSAEAVYRLALDEMGVNSRSMHRDALSEIFRAAMRQQHVGGRRETLHGGLPAPTPHMAFDGHTRGTLPASVERTLSAVRSLG